MNNKYFLWSLFGFVGNLCLCAWQYFEVYFWRFHSLIKDETDKCLFTFLILHRSGLPRIYWQVACFTECFYLLWAGKLIRVKCVTCHYIWVVWGCFKYQFHFSSHMPLGKVITICIENSYIHFLFAMNVRLIWGKFHGLVCICLVSCN